MTCRVASRIVSSSKAQKPRISSGAVPTLATRLFRRIASKGSRPIPRPGWRESEPDKERSRCRFAAAGVATQWSWGDKRRVVWRSIAPATSFLPSPLPTNGGRP
jgi:hypothetical protein